MSCCRSAIQNFESADWPRNIFKAPFAQIGELNRDFASDVIVGGRRDADTTGLCDAFKPRRYVYAVPKNVMRLDNYVADINAHPKGNAIVFRLIDCKFVNVVLELERSSNRFDRARKLRQEPIASVFDNAATVFTNCRGDSVRQEHCQFDVRSLFVIVHEPRVASHVGGQYRRQPALDPDWPLLHHGSQPNPSRILYDGSEDRASCVLKDRPLPKSGARVLVRCHCLKR
jgi:hypothetical protein